MAGALASAGASVVLVGRQAGMLDEAVAGIRTAGGAADRVSADLGDRAAIGRACHLIGEPFGAPDILVNAAGVNIRPPLRELTADDWDRSLEVNLTAPFLLGQHFGPGMAARGWGRIINVASQQAIRAFGNSGGYGASKGGLVSLTRSQAEAWAAAGVCCNAIAPGFVPTDDDPAGSFRSRPLRGPGGAHHDRAQRAARGLRGYRRLLGEQRERLHHRTADLRRRRLLSGLTPASNGWLTTDRSPTRNRRLSGCRPRRCRGIRVPRRRWPGHARTHLTG